jgi:hypothetical protein
MFLHANTTQLLEIMAVPWICGDNVEDALGHRRYLLFYVFCGVVAGMVHVYFNATSDIPLVGASGAIVGMIGGYVVLYPRIKMWALVGVIPLRLNASWVLGWWAVSQVATLFVAPSERSASGRISAALFAACCSSSSCGRVPPSCCSPLSAGQRPRRRHRLPRDGGQRPHQRKGDQPHHHRPRGKNPDVSRSLSCRAICAASCSLRKRKTWPLLDLAGQPMNTSPQ